MLAFPSMIERAAIEAGIKVPPDDCETYDKSEYPHWAVFCAAQLGRAMTEPGEHWENAKVIAAISDEDICKVTVSDLTARGFMGLD